MKDKKIDILFIHHTKAIGGAFISMIKLIEALDKRKYSSVVLLLKDPDGIELLKEKGIKFIVAPQKFYKKYYQFFPHYVPGMKWYNFLLLAIRSISWLLSRFYYSKKLLKDIDPDIIHLNSSVLTDFLYAANSKAKVIIHIREALADGYFGLRKAFIRSLIKKYADHIIAISHDNAARLKLPYKTSVVHNFLEIPNQDQLDEYETKPKHILYVGGSSFIKGFYTLVDSLNYIDDNIKIIFAGRYPKENALKGFIKFLPKNIRFRKAKKKMHAFKQVVEVGFTNNVYQLIMETEFLISPFTVEHFSRPVIEAFAHKKPAIGTDVVGMDEIIDHNINGLIVPKNNYKALAEAINYLCANTGLVKRMGENGYHKAKKLFSPNNTKQIEKIYTKLCES